MIRGTKHISVVRENARKTKASTGVENGATARAQIRMKSGELGNTMPINALRNHLVFEERIQSRVRAVSFAPRFGRWSAPWMLQLRLRRPSMEGLEHKPCQETC